MYIVNHLKSRESINKFFVLWVFFFLTPIIPPTRDHSDILAYFLSVFFYAFFFHD